MLFEEPPVPGKQKGFNVWRSVICVVSIKGKDENLEESAKKPNVSEKYNR